MKGFVQDIEDLAVMNDELAYGSFTYTKDTHDAKLGPLELSVKDKETVKIPLWVGVGAIVIGGRPSAGWWKDGVVSEEANMPDDKTPTELNRVTAEKGREEAEDLREEADHERGSAEEHRAVAESSRTEAEQFRVLADEARTLREQYREQMESVRQEREALRHAAEEARQAAEGARHATIASVAATADALRTNLAQMQFLEDARNTLRQLKLTKPGNVQ